MQQRRPPRHPVLANIGLVLASIVVFLVAGEFLLRAFLGAGSLWHYPNYIEQAYAPDPEHVAQMRYDPLLGYEPIPGYKGTLAGKPISFDAMGLREHDLGGPAPAGPVILAIGDSFTEGYLVGNDETWPANLQRVTGRPVLNAGVRSYGLDQIVLRAERIVPKIRPDTIVLGFIPDDVERTEMYLKDNRPKPYFVLSKTGEDGLELRNVPVPTEPPPPAWWRHYVGYSYFLHYFMTRLVLFETWFGISRHAHHDGDEVSCRLMHRFARLVRDQGARALVVAFYEDTAWRFHRMKEANREQTAYVLGCAARAGLATLDTWDGFTAAGMPQKGTVFYNGFHFTDAGANVAARLIAGRLAALGPAR
jgi:hypothetical protein